MLLDLTNKNIKAINSKELEDFVDPEAFANCETIDLSSNQIEQIDPEAFFVLCQFERLKTLNLGNNKIKQVFTETRAESGVLLSSRIEELNLSSNKLTSIAENGLIGFAKLTRLNLSGNQIESFELSSETYKAICELENLKILDLSCNRIKSNSVEKMKPRADDQLPRLFSKSMRSLNLSKNLLTLLTEDIGFEGFINLSELDLSGNKIKIPKEENSQVKFKKLSRLSALNLSSNLIVNLYDFTLRNLTNLQSVNLADNQMNYVHARAFSSARQSLTRVDLSQNNLVSVPSGIFEGMQNIRMVDYSRNKLERFNKPHEFKALERLEVLDLSSNNFKIFYRESFENMRDEARINLTGNKYREPFDFGNKFADLIFKIEDTVNLRSINECPLVIGHVLNKKERTVKELKNELRKIQSEHSVLDYLIAEMKVPSSFLLNIINFIQLTARLLKIPREGVKKAISIRRASTFEALCENEEVNVEALSFMLRNNQCELDHEYIKYFRTAFSQRNESTAFCILDFMLDSRMTLTKELWALFYQNKWWNGFERVLDHCQTPSGFHFSLLELEFDRIERVKRRESGKKLKSSDILAMVELGELIEEKQLVETAERDSEERGMSKSKLAKETKKFHPLVFIMKSDQPKLLNHSATRAFVKKKWRALPKYFYYITLLVYSVFLINYSLYSSLFFARQELGPDWLHRSKLVSTALLVVFICYELIQITLEKIEYFKKKKNCFEFVSLPLSLVAVFLSDPSSIKTRDAYLFLVTILLNYLIFMMRWNKFKKFGVYIIAFEKVLKKSLFLVPLVGILFASFLLMFKIRSEFKASDRELNQGTISKFNGTLSKTAIQLLTMMLGEIDLRESDYGLGEGLATKNAVNYFLIFLFIGLMTIFVYNIFVGIAVDEISQIVNESQVSHLKAIASYVLEFQAFLCLLSSSLKFKMIFNEPMDLSEREAKKQRRMAKSDMANAQILDEFKKMMVEIEKMKQDIDFVKSSVMGDNYKMISNLTEILKRLNTQSSSIKNNSK